MPTYWDSFIGKYKDKLPYRSIGSILEAFWYFSHAYENENYMKQCDEIMGA